MIASFIYFDAGVFVLLLIWCMRECVCVRINVVKEVEMQLSCLDPQRMRKMYAAN